VKPIALRRAALLSLAFALTLFVGGICAQETAPAAGQNPPAAQPGSGNPNTAIGSELAKESEAAEHSEEHEENAQFKYSPTVKWFAKTANLDPRTAYFISLIINFGILVLFFYILLRGKIPAMFRDRTNSIQKAIRDAQAASAEATEKMQKVEARLAKLDSEVASFRAEVEKQAAGEEERIRASAEEDKRRVVESARMEIDAVARNARRDLKSYAAALAVDIAGKRIKVDERSDNALVREFVDHLEKGGKQ